MGEAAEAGDDVVVMPGPLQGLGIPERLVEADGARLMERILGMREREVEELAEQRVDPRIEALGDGALCCNKGSRIRFVDPGGSPEHVSGELVEEQHQRQGTFGGIQPAVEIAPRRGLVSRQEAVAADLVEALVGGKPAVRSRLSPEGDDLVRRRDPLHNGLLVASARATVRARARARSASGPPRGNATSHVSSARATCQGSLVR